MPIEFSRAYLSEISSRYKNSTRKEKSKILDEFCTVNNYNRKHAIRILNGVVRPRVRKPGPASKYNRSDVLKALKELWQLMNEMCSKKMKVAFVDWLPFYECSDEVQVLLLQISSSTIDRLLRPYRKPLMKGISTTKKSYFKNKIPIKLLDEEIRIPGYVEGDTVAHCGVSAGGEFASSLTITDLCSGWTENRAMLTKKAEKVTEKLKDIEDRLPFTLIGLATDNGSEFLNENVVDYMRNREIPINMVRRRSYKKNDNAHVEQKNNTHVRQLFGYDRIEDPGIVLLMNEIYMAYWNPLLNFFTPVLKLKSKERSGGRVKKIYDEPKSPYKRLLENTYVPEKEKAKLREAFALKNPIYLKKELDKKLKEFYKRVEEHIRIKKLTGS